MQVHELINFNARQQRHGNMGNMAPQQVCYPSTGRRSIDDRRYYATVYPIEYSIEEPLSPRPWQLPSLSIRISQMGHFRCSYRGASLWAITNNCLFSNDIPSTLNL